ncbi:MAG: DUF45 domain-containing protein [Treponema sp.]|nr:DUF45 domain-containing protein [Treponema sp.]
MIYDLPNTDIQITISKKRIRSFRLRVDRGGNVFCSVPHLASLAKIEEFISSKSAWIQKSVEKVKSLLLKSDSLSEDSVAFSLGLQDSDFLGETNSAQSAGRGERVYSQKWKSLALEIFRATLEKQYRLFENTELIKKMPALSKITLKGRKLKSMWGSCNRRTNTITLNYELLRFSQICIEYVVLHELTHFLNISHDKKFYATVARFMPNYKAVVKMMK